MQAQNIGEIIKEARKKKGYTLEELGKKFGVTRQAIHCIESGKKGVPIRKMELLSQALDLPVQNLLIGNYLKKIA